MGVVPSHMGDMCACVEYVMDSLKRQEEAMNTRDNPLALFDKLLRFVLCAHRDTGMMA